jgi:hypothetical protein
LDTSRKSLSRLLKTFAWIVTFPFAALYLLFDLGELLSGDLSGLMHLLPSAFLVVPLILAVWRPLPASPILLLAGLVFFNFSFGSGDGIAIPVFFVAPSCLAACSSWLRIITQSADFILN